MVYYTDGIVQHPSIQQNIIAVALGDDLSHPSLSRATDAVHALSLLGPAASSTVDELLALLNCTAIAPSLVCNALALVSTTHNRTGELELANLVATAIRPEVRQCASQALGQLFRKTGARQLLNDGAIETPVPVTVARIFSAIFGPKPGRCT